MKGSIWKGKTGEHSSYIPRKLIEKDFLVTERNELALQVLIRPK